MISKGISNPDIGTPEKKKEQLAKFWTVGVDMLHKNNFCVTKKNCDKTHVKIDVKIGLSLAYFKPCQTSKMKRLQN